MHRPCRLPSKTLRRVHQPCIAQKLLEKGRPWRRVQVAHENDQALAVREQLAEGAKMGVAQFGILGDFWRNRMGAEDGNGFRFDINLNEERGKLSFTEV